MNKYYIGQAFQPVSTAGSKPMQDFDFILRKKGVKNIGLPEVNTNTGKVWFLWNLLSVKLALFTMPKNGIVFVQYPFQPYIDKIVKKAKKRNNKIVILIHDLDILRDNTADSSFLLKISDVLLVHTHSMREWMEENIKLNNNIVILDIFDYLGIASYQNSVLDKNNVSIVFAGNLGKASFLKELSFLKDDEIKFILFGPNPPRDILNSSNVIYKGLCLPEELGKRIKGYAFGLVWDGNSIDGCTGILGNYLRYNCPYKISSYIAAGLPVIVWSQMGMSKFVKEYGIGMDVASLKELKVKINKLSSEDYAKMKKNVKKLQNQLCNGWFYSKAIDNALKLININ